MLIEKLSKIRAGATFLSVRGYKSAEGEIADFSIVFHMSYGNALERSIAALESVVPETDLESQAKAELLESYNKSLTKVRTEPLEVIGEHYDRVFDADGEIVKGVKIHRATDTLHLFGLLAAKRVIVPGNHKTVNKRPLTVAKDKLRKGLPVNKFRQFIIAPGSCDAINVENLSLLPE